ncbi:MAG: hypothetical protein JW819_10590 [Candidatus Krumholzibacteriota bacterium]|nr:hypothetical protein [Candidatus Krumholzibacteriota bacterium]
MSPVLAIAFFFALTVGWALLPFLPAWAEARRRRDAAPLQVVRRAEVDVRHFARRFRDFLAQHLTADLDAAQADGRSREGRLEDGTGWLIAGADTPALFTAAEAGERVSQRLLLALGDLTLPAEHSFLQEVFAAGALAGGPRNIYRAMLADGPIILGEESTTLRWLHTEDALVAGNGCALYGRVSAVVSIRLGEGCRFERLHAPAIAFGAADEPAETNGDEAGGGRELTPRDLPGQVDFGAGRCLVEGDLEIEAEARIDFDLVVVGRLRLGRGVRVDGSVKCRRDAELGPGVVIAGSLVCGRHLRLGAGCRIGGPLLAEGDVVLGAGCRVGGAGRPTTLSARRVTVAAGGTVHGTVWAHEGGRLLAAGETGEARHA